jgi:SAM-dependent methyltransferase
MSSAPPDASGFPPTSSPLRTVSSAARCPLCGAAARRAFAVGDRNRESTDEVFAYARCGSCRTVFMLDPPSDLARYYEGDYYHFDAAGEPEWKHNQVRLDSAAYRVRLLLEHVAPGPLIEIGAGTGAFAAAAKAAGFDVTAIEMDEACCRYLREHEGVAAICSDRPLAVLDSLPPARVVAMWHVLEHLPNPADVLERIAAQLEPGGVLAIGVPNASSLQFRLMGSRWPQVDAPRHLCLMPPDALLRKGEQLGLRGVAITTTDPEGLDFDLFGWANALRRHPASGPTSKLVGYAALALRRAAAPLERTGNRGSAVTLLLRKES